MAISKEKHPFWNSLEPNSNRNFPIQFTKVQMKETLGPAVMPDDLPSQTCL